MSFNIADDMAPLPRDRRKFPVGDIRDDGGELWEFLETLMLPEDFDEEDALGGPHEDDGDAPPIICEMMENAVPNPWWLGGVSDDALELLLERWAHTVDEDGRTAYVQTRIVFHFTVAVMLGVLPRVGLGLISEELEVMAKYRADEIKLVINNAWSTMERSHPRLFAHMELLAQKVFTAYEFPASGELLIRGALVLPYLLSSWSRVWELRTKVRAIPKQA